MSESLEPERNPGSDCGGEALVDQQATCPAPSDLLSFLEDGLDEPTASRIVQHVDTCLKCQETLAEISGELELHGPEPIPFFLRRLSERDPDALNDDDWVDHFFDGDTTIGSYRIDKEIGRGAMGIVFRGIDRELDRPVAIKVLRPSLSATESFRSRFLRESQVMAKIDHPNVVPVYDVGQHEGVPFVAMKLLQGESLRERLRRVGSLDNDSLEELAIQAATGLEAVHREGLVHRDIKPANLFLEAPNDRVRLLDFGLASQRDSAQVTQVGTLLGSPAYMSPEQARGETVDARSDLFSLGSTLYEAASGNLPFAADSTIGVITQLVSQDPVPIREQAPAISARLAKQINLLLEKAPKRRPASAKSVRTALEATTGLVLPPRLLKVLVGVAFVTILAAVVVFRLKTPHGELTVEFADGVDPKNIAIEATSGGEVKLLNAEQGWTIRVSNGEYNVRLSNGSDRFELNKDSITVFNTEKQYLKVRLKKLVAPAPQSARDVAAWVLSVGGEVTTTAPGAKSLSELEQLPERVDGIEVIDLRGTDIGDDDVRRLTSLATLQSLCLGSTSGGRTRLSGKALSILDRTPELVDLQLSGIIMDGETLQQIGSTTSLKSLSIKDGMVADDDL
ncbi:MAG: serine/threonine-protein kinase, partial [Planctomycetota bacterium]